MSDDHALVLLAKWPGSGSAKTRLTGQLASFLSPHLNPHLDASRWVADFVRAAVLDLVCRFGSAAPAQAWQCVLLYAPPVDEARAYFAGLLEEAGVAHVWRLMPVLEASDAKSANLGDLLTDAAQRARSACGVSRVAFFGADCPELPLSSVKWATAAVADDARVAAICPARDGGYTLLALPASADAARCFDGVSWSADNTCLSQLAALARADLLCVVGETHADVDELDDLRALAKRLSAGAPASAAAEEVEEATARSDSGGGGGSGDCPRCAALLSRMSAAKAL